MWNERLLFRCIVNWFPIASESAWSQVGETEQAILYAKRAMTLTDNSVKSILTTADIFEHNNEVEAAEEVLNSLPENQQENANFQR